MRRFGEISDALASGLMRVRGVRRQRAYDRGFVLSDHADWPSLLSTIRESGASRVLATHGHAEPLARYLGADDLIANKMQFNGGFATGKVVPPIVEGANKAHAIREYCVKHQLALDKSHAYSDSASDYAMLAIVGRPTAVNPDLRLRSLARAYNWPVLDLR
jgi:phosphoserine phosphatase